MRNPQACISCGRAVEPEKAEITEDGLRCLPCSLEQGARDAQVQLVVRDEEAYQKSLGRRARVLGHAHVVAWGGIAALWDRDSIFIPAVAAGLATFLGLARRRRWAFRAALSGDAAGAAALLVAASPLAGAEAVGFLAPIAAVPALLGGLLWTLRGAFPVTTPEAREMGQGAGQLEGDEARVKALPISKESSR